jgi:uncharacterized protein YqeY
MSLKSRIDQDIKDAMRSKDQDALRTLRSIKSMILLAETEKGASKALSQADEMKLLTKAAKQRKESADTFAAQGREDLAQKELTELEIINQYLPKPLSEEELVDELKKIIEQEGAAGIQDMGKVMGRATTELAGRADGKQISQHVRALLNH